MTRSRRLGVPAAVAVLLVALTGCTTGPSRAASSPSPSEEGERIGQLVTIGAIGDSISLGANACGQIAPCPPASWVTGDDSRVRSVATRIEESTSSPVEVYNAAKVGAAVADLERQVSLITPRDPDLVTVFIGANDICKPSAERMTSVGGFEQAVASALTTLSTDAPSALIYVATIPDLVGMAEEAATSEQAVQAWSRFSSCDSVLLDPRSTDPAAIERRDAVRDRVEQYNAVLERVCASLDRCLSDDGAFFEVAIGIDDMSTLDYFHPGIGGQRALAEAAWVQLADEFDE